MTKSHSLISAECVVKIYLLLIQSKLDLLWDFLCNIYKSTPGKRGNQEKPKPSNHNLNQLVCPKETSHSLSVDLIIRNSRYASLISPLIWWRDFERCFLFCCLQWKIAKHWCWNKQCRSIVSTEVKKQVKCTHSNTQLIKGSILQASCFYFSA